MISAPKNIWTEVDAVHQPTMYSLSLGLECLSCLLKQIRVKCQLPLRSSFLKLFDIIPLIICLTSREIKEPSPQFTRWKLVCHVTIPCTPFLFVLKKFEEHSTVQDMVQLLTMSDAKMIEISPECTASLV